VIAALILNWPALFPTPPAPPVIPVTLVMQPSPPVPKPAPQPPAPPPAAPKHELVSGPDQETTAPAKPEEKGPDAAPETAPPPLPTAPNAVAAIPEPKPKPPESHPPKPKPAPRVSAPDENPRGSVERAPGEALHSGDPYLNQLWSLIEAHRFYPPGAIGSLGLPLEGTATFLIAIRSDGVLQGVQLQHSAGADALDRAALKMIETAAPFPPPPPATYPPPGVVLEVTIHMFPGAS